MNALRLKSLLLGFALLAIGCQAPVSKTPAVQLAIQYAQQPLPAGASSIAVTLTDPAGLPVTRAHVTVEGNMAHPGMAPVFSQAAESIPGTYRSTVNFSMPGDWVLTVHARLADGGMVEKESNLTVTGK